MNDLPEHISNLSTSSDPGETYSPLPDGYQLGKTKYIIITGSVMSGLGKGIFSAGLAKLLENCGLRTNLIKIDGYFNEDAGTLSPFRHGEVFVLDDGTECDMDVGTYERFVNKNFSSLNIFTNGRLIRRINSLERNGLFKGSDVQFYPHVTGEVIRFVRESSVAYNADITLVEIGGTVGDEENRTYISAMSDLSYREGEQNVYFINLAWIIEATHLKEQKSKAAQHGTNLLMQMGIKPHMLVCRAENELQTALKTKLANRLRLPQKNVIDLHNLDTIYHVPRHLETQHTHEIVLNFFFPGTTYTNKEDPAWSRYIDRFTHPDGEIRIGLAGKYMGPRDTYASIHNALEHAATKLNKKVKVIDLPADEIEKETLDHDELLSRMSEHMNAIDGVIVPGGFGKRGLEGKVACIRYVRENKIPFLGLCYGFQAAMIEYARSVCGIPNANSTEIKPDAGDPVICLLPEQYDTEGIGGNMRLGKHNIELLPGSLAAAIYQSDFASERFRHRFEFNPDYRDIFEKNGIVFSGWAPGRPIMQIAELPGHPFFLGVQFHPEYTSRPVAPNPAFFQFLTTCAERKSVKA